MDEQLRTDVARVLGMKPSEIVDVVEEDDNGGVVVVTHDGVHTRIDDQGGTQVVAAPVPVPRDPATGIANESVDMADQTITQPDGTISRRRPGVGAGLVADEAELCPECRGTGLRNPDAPGVVETVPAPLVTAPDENAADRAAGDVPDGNAEQVLTWVGDDRERAQRALDAERAGKQRSGLTAQLEKLAEVDQA